MKRMLFNATQQEELRVAIVNGQKLIDIDIETTGRELRKSNIYKGVITRIEPSLEACFVNYGEERHGFLPFKEVARSYFKEGIDVRNSSIKDALREGQEIIVQVEKEERGNKGAALTSFISLAGRYLVLMTNNPRGGGVSRRVEGEDRQELRETMDKLDLPQGMSVIARTAGIGRNVDELQWDLNYLMQLWRAIDGAGKSAQGAFLIYQESSLVIRAIRDYFQPDIGEILIDTDDIYEQAQQFMSHVMPDMVHRVKRYSDDVPLFSRFQIEHQIETAYSRTVPLPSGGAIVIDHTEALVSVDVNSARATRGGDIETTAFNTNCEAAEEVARQLRLRDLGGLIVIDFIDMENAKNQREVETRLKDALRYDRARVQMGKISRFGLMELSRQRLRPSLSEGSHVTCPRCNGTGHIRDTESSALQVLRIIQEEAMKENSAAIHVQVPVDVAAFLLNEKRGEILKIENRHRVTAILIPNKHLETPHYKLDRLKHDDPRLEEAHVSYAMAEQADTDIGYNKRQKDEVKPRQEAVVKSITPETAPIVERKPAPVATSTKVSSEGGFFAGIAKFFSSIFSTTESKTPVAEEKPKQGRDRNDRNRQRNRGQNGRNGRNGRGTQDNDERQANSNGQSRTEKETAKAPVPAALESNTQAKQGKQNRQPRDEKDGQEGRRERQQRQREGKKEQANNEPKTEEGMTTHVSLQAATPAIQKPKAQDGQDALSVGIDADQAEPQAEEGRRRRRGGRNRNRRDRNPGENTEAQITQSEQQNEGKTEQAPAFIPVADLATSNPATVESLLVEIAPAQASFDLAPSTTASSGVETRKPEQETTLVTSAAPSHSQGTANLDASTPNESIEAGSSKPIVAEANVTPSIEVEASPIATVVPTLNQIDESTQVAISDQAVSVTSSVDEVTVAEVITENTIESEISAAANLPTQAALPMFTETPPAATIATSEAIDSTANQASQVVQSSTSVADLDAMLAQAGLVLAATDPEKLKSAQAAAQVPVAPRVTRERKPAPPVTSEPLVMIETKR
ncbi:Rne/Rng family ribonuclease [Undibacterium fentianense]|uniref:Ribonuclease E n=1 Tax=Undibacterium fentianense TaxID=2828728 RepID=A0A941E3E6_9BURK|nr:Rne/Rng family ribonuclease [Undibacterium fentianense]MBR7798988.1 Rne/Rng family ribonuclease [Undibacterium fentianense]